MNLTIKHSGENVSSIVAGPLPTMSGGMSVVSLAVLAKLNLG